MHVYQLPSSHAHHPPAQRDGRLQCWGMALGRALGGIAGQTYATVPHRLMSCILWRQEGQWEGGARGMSMADPMVRNQTNAELMLRHLSDPVQGMRDSMRQGSGTGLDMRRCALLLGRTAPRCSARAPWL